MRTMNNTLRKIAKEVFPNVETLETRKSDRLDFYDTAVWQLKEALEEAYKAGVKSERDKMVRRFVKSLKTEWGEDED